MKKDQLPFRIGEDYETWEFDLIVLNYETIPFYDSYLYVGEVKKFLNILPDKTELIFSLDILELVIMTITTEDHREMEKLIDLMTKTFGDYIEHEQEYLSACIYKLEDSNQIWLIYSPLEDITYLAYGSPKLINHIFWKCSKE